ncbi:MAG: hypothetical protein MUE74_10270 [Bacteroidales bacterium]|jgi:hypothetical protein|nr:hypothetical protein [Bacteroidales bacterium]
MKRILILLLSSFLSAYSIAQNPLLPDKPGTFEILARTDYVTSDCGFTKAEVDANFERIKAVVGAMRQNPVLSDIRGFVGRARIYAEPMTCRLPGWYGVSSRLCFEFCSWFINKDGRESHNLYEPPEWSLYINDMIPGWADIADAKHGYFTVPLRKKNAGPGIDVYDGECFVIYDPSRPRYWIPVTVDEAFAAAREFAAKEKDEFTASLNKQLLDQEYAAIPASERNKPAYYGGNLSRVSATSGFAGQDSLFPYIMKVNPEYWNRNLPRSDIQFIYFSARQNKKYLEGLMDEYLKKNSISYHAVRFELSLGIEDFKRLKALIGK